MLIIDVFNFSFFCVFILLIFIIVGFLGALFSLGINRVISAYFFFDIFIFLFWFFFLLIMFLFYNLDSVLDSFWLNVDFLSTCSSLATNLNYGSGQIDHVIFNYPSRAALQCRFDTVNNHFKNKILSYLFIFLIRRLFFLIAHILWSPLIFINFFFFESFNVLYRYLEGSFFCGFFSSKNYPRFSVILNFWEIFFIVYLFYYWYFSVFFDLSFGCIYFFNFFIKDFYFYLTLLVFFFGIYLLFLIFFTFLLGAYSFLFPIFFCHYFYIVSDLFPFFSFFFKFFIIVFFMLSLFHFFIFNPLLIIFIFSSFW